MAFQFYNPNPKGRFVGDCTIRAICKLTNQDWDHVYAATSFQEFLAKDMPSGNATWGAYLARLGYIRKFIPDSYLGRYTVKGGDYYDTWDSGNEMPSYYWTKGDQ